MEQRISTAERLDGIKKYCYVFEDGSIIKKETVTNLLKHMESTMEATDSIDLNEHVFSLHVHLSNEQILTFLGTVNYSPPLVDGAVYTASINSISLHKEVSVQDSRGIWIKFSLKEQEFTPVIGEVLFQKYDWESVEEEEIYSMEKIFSPRVTWVKLVE